MRLELKGSTSRSSSRTISGICDRNISSWTRPRLKFRCEWISNLCHISNFSFLPQCIKASKMPLSSKVRVRMRKLMKSRECWSKPILISWVSLPSSPSYTPCKYLLKIDTLPNAYLQSFEMLAFKNDVSHWRKKDELTGVSVRYVNYYVWYNSWRMLMKLDRTVR